MATNLYLAMTAAEYHAAPSLPSRVAWMACHFSPYALGLSNIPDNLPEDSLLILSDVIPIHGHDPRQIVRELTECMELHHCRGLLLDFQRAPNPETETLTDILTQGISVPVAVAEPFANNREGPIFLSPCPPHIPLAQYITPWKNREIWLETAFSPTQLLLTPAGTTVSHEAESPPEKSVFTEETLHCHYHIQTGDTHVRFQLWRTEDDIETLIKEGSELGIRQFVGLYQEFSSFAHSLSDIKGSSAGLPFGL